MALLLCLETSTKACSVALGLNGKVIAVKESMEEKHSHAENLTLYIQNVLKEKNSSLQNLDAIAVSMGPGSFTGLRIGVSTAKGLCYALNKPLIAVKTLEAMAADCINTLTTANRHQSLFCPMIDARRLEVYCALFNEKGDEIKKTAAELIDENSFSDFLPDNKILFFGDGATKCKNLISHPNALFLDDIHPTAQSMVVIAEKYFSEKKFEDVAYFEPFYLKDFFTPSVPTPGEKMQ
jgi:tRNA threonylcarbamoyladenosine biosynthesis protein TsaB